MTTTPHPDRTPISHSVVYAVRGMPDVPNLHGPGTLAPTKISLTYLAAEDPQLGRVHVYLSGRWRPESDGPATDGLPGQHYSGDMTRWPAQLVEEARVHDPDTAAPKPQESVDPAYCARCVHDERTRGVLQLSNLELYPPDHAPSCRVALVDRAAQAIRDSNATPEALAWWKAHPQLIPAHVYANAALTVAESQHPGDRAAIYAEVADRLAADAEQGDKEGFTRIYHRAAAFQVRMWGTELASDQNAVPATTCSAQYDARVEEWDAMRLCIRAAHHVGQDHVDEHGFHWSDTVAAYPTADGTLRMSPVLAGLRRVVCDVQQPEAQARRPLVRWYVERRNHDGWWPASSPTRPQERAAQSLSERRAAHPHNEFRLARATTTYTVEATDPSRPEDEAGLIVAYQSRDGRQLRCLVHAPAANLIGLDWFARTGLDVDSDASSCTETGCGRDVLAEETPYCSAGLLPKGSAPVERCVVEVPHDEHVTAQGKRWTDEASA
ncbi:hypothetical protein [Streptomyces sp. NPDC051554]|uniref:hypothetical protein n=1 Tax=Streptomyces sp. NPDC051554 TaxID=3365656 RepID=UPI00379491B9